MRFALVVLGIGVVLCAGLWLLVIQPGAPGAPGDRAAEAEAAAAERAGGSAAEAAREAGTARRPATPVAPGFESGSQAAAAWADSEAGQALTPYAAWRRARTATRDPAKTRRRDPRKGAGEARDETGERVEGEVEARDPGDLPLGLSEEEIERRQQAREDQMLENLPPEDISKIPHTPVTAWDSEPGPDIGDHIFFDLEVPAGTPDPDIATLIGDYNQAYADHPPIIKVYYEGGTGHRPVATSHPGAQGPIVNFIPELMRNR